MEDFPDETVTLKSRNDSIVDVYINKNVGVTDHKYKYKSKLDNSYNINTLKKKNKFDKPCKKK